MSYNSKALKDPLPSPINFTKWLDENGDKLRPPVNNAIVQVNKDFVVMAIGGPNSRTDYHVNETEEWFYQYKGDMVLKIFDTHENRFRDIIIKENEMFLLPGNVPHSPCRFADTVGIVIERVRPKGAIDKLRWYCENDECLSIVFEEGFECVDLGGQLKPIIEKYYRHPELRTCAKCGQINRTPESYNTQSRPV